MKPYEQIIGEAVRIEYLEREGKLFIVFEIKDEKQKQNIIKNWTNDIEFRLVDKSLVKDDEEK